MLRTELKKFLSFRVFWILLVCLLCISGYDLVTKAYQYYYTPVEYRALYEELDGMSFQEVEDCINAKIEAADTGNNPEYNANLYYDTLEIINILRNYPTYLESISTNTEAMMEVSIWGGKNTFSYRNIEKTPAAYAAMSGTTLTLSPSLGIEKLLSSPMTDLFGILLLFLGVNRIFLRDREQGVLSLLYATPDGRYRLMGSKIGTALLCAAGLVLVFYGERFLITEKLYGLGDLSRPIQCVYGYDTCNLPVSVGEYLGIFLLFKLVAYAVFTAIFGFFCTISKNNLMVYATCGGTVGLFYLLYQKIFVLSPLSLLHFWNPIQFLQSKEIFGTYTNVNCFGYPIFLKISVCIVAGVLLFLFLGGSLFYFSHAGNLQYRTITIRKQWHFQFRVHRTFWYTCYRILILQKGLLVVLLLVAVSIGMAQTYTQNYSNEDIYYSNFCEEYAGSVTERTRQFIAEKRAHYQEIEAQITESEENSISYYQLQALQAELLDRNALEKFAQRVEQIPDTAEIFYDTGYARYFALDGNQEGMVQVLLLTTALMLLLSPTVSMDRKTNLITLYRATKTGRIGYDKQAFCFAALAGILFSLLLTLPYLWEILNHYGTQGWTTPLAGMEAYATIPTWITVGMAAVFVIIIRMIGAVLVGGLITGIAAHCKSLVTAYCVNGVLFVLPAGLCLLGLNMFQYVGLTLILYGII